jgi:hypothetical protein
VSATVAPLLARLDAGTHLDLHVGRQPSVDGLGRSGRARSGRLGERRLERSDDRLRSRAGSCFACSMSLFATGTVTTSESLGWLASTGSVAGPYQEPRAASMAARPPHDARLSSACPDPAPRPGTRRNQTEPNGNGFPSDIRDFSAKPASALSFLGQPLPLSNPLGDAARSVAAG